MNRPKIGLAFSGGSGRAIAHAGVLDVLTENGIPVDYIAACSSGTFIAAAYACGTLPSLKKYIFEDLTHRELLGLFRASSDGSGILSLDALDQKLLVFTKGLNMEDVRPHLAFVAVDLNNGEQVAISMGDMIRAIKASCSVPGLFEPVKWGHKRLADGGLVNIVPADVVKEMGADIVISVDIAASRYVFSPRSLQLFRNLLRIVNGTTAPFTYARKVLKLVGRALRTTTVEFYSQSDVLDQAEESYGVLKVIGQVLEISARRLESTITFEDVSDIIIEPKVKHFGRTDFKSLLATYQESRRATISVLPKIKKLLEGSQAGKLTGQVSPSPLTTNQ